MQAHLSRCDPADTIGLCDLKNRIKCDNRKAKCAAAFRPAPANISFQIGTCFSKHRIAALIDLGSCDRAGGKKDHCQSRCQQSAHHID